MKYAVDVMQTIIYFLIFNSCICAVCAV